MFNALRELLGIAPGALKAGAGVGKAIAKGAQQLAEPAFNPPTTQAHALEQLPASAFAHPIGGSLPTINGQRGPFSPEFMNESRGNNLPVVNGQRGPWSLAFAGLNTPGMTRPGADFNGIQPSTSFDETLQGYNQDDLSNGLQGGEVNQGFIPMQNGGFGAPSASSLQPTLTLASLLKRK